jgi:Uma2 family endonuclease
VLEVWIIDRDTTIPQVHRLTAGHYVVQSGGKDGWILSAAAGIELKTGAPGKLAMRLAGDETTRQDLP